MTLVITHTKVSAVPDVGDASLVEPSDWNANHTLTGVISGVQGGTGQSTYVKGDILASPGSNTLNKLAVSTDGFVLTADAASTNGIKWAAAASGLTINTTGITGGTTLRLLYDNAGTVGETTDVTFTATGQLTLTSEIITSADTTSTFLNIINTNASQSWNLAVAGSGIGGTGAFFLFDNTTFGLPLCIFPRSAGFGVNIQSDGYYGFSASNQFAQTAADLAIFRDAADILAQRRTTNPQVFRLYNTYTDASNYERAVLDWTSTANFLTIGTQAAGSGTARGFKFVFGSSVLFDFGATSSARITFNPAGTSNHFVAFYPATNSGIAVLLDFAANGNGGDAYYLGAGITGANSTFEFHDSSAGHTRYSINSTGSFVIGDAAISTTATDGFLYIPTCAGTPTGTPTAWTGRVPMVYDTTNNKFYIYNGAWKGGTNPGAFT